MLLEELGLLPSDSEPKTEEEKAYRKILRDILAEIIARMCTERRDEIVKEATERAKFIMKFGGRP